MSILQPLLSVSVTLSKAEPISEKFTNISEPFTEVVIVPFPEISHIYVDPI